MMKRILFLGIVYFVIFVGFASTEYIDFSSFGNDLANQINEQVNKSMQNIFKNINQKTSYTKNLKTIKNNLIVTGMNLDMSNTDKLISDIFSGVLLNQSSQYLSGNTKYIPLKQKIVQKNNLKMVLKDDKKNLLTGDQIKLENKEVIIKKEIITKNDQIIINSGVNLQDKKLLKIDDNVYVDPKELSDNESDPVLSKTRADMLVRLNKERSASGKSSYVLNDRLDLIAQKFAKYLYDTKDFEHVTKSGQTPLDRAKLGGYDYKYYGENIAGYFDGVDKVMDAWMASQGHKENIMNQNFSEVGIGMYGNFRVQEFGTRN